MTLATAELPPEPAVIEVRGRYLYAIVDRDHDRLACVLTRHGRRLGLHDRRRRRSPRSSATCPTRRCVPSAAGSPPTTKCLRRLMDRSHGLTDGLRPDRRRPRIGPPDLAAQPRGLRRPARPAARQGRDGLAGQLGRAEYLRIHRGYSIPSWRSIATRSSAAAASRRRMKRSSWGGFSTGSSRPTARRAPSV